MYDLVQFIKLCKLIKNGKFLLFGSAPQKVFTDLQMIYLI